MTLYRLIKRLIAGAKVRLKYLFYKPQFKEWHISSNIITPILISNKSFISIGENVRIMHHARIEAVTIYQGQQYKPELIIRNNVTIQQNLHITCASRVEIGECTAVVANVTITDIIHPYSADDIHLVKTPIVTKPVIIGQYCGIYNNVVINAGVTIGNHVTIGANSVVTKDIPDYCVAVGAPARIIKRYNFESKKWENTDEYGNFL